MTWVLVEIAGGKMLINLDQVVRIEPITLLGIVKPGSRLTTTEIGDDGKPVVWDSTTPFETLKRRAKAN